MTKYNADAIEVLTGLEPVRKRPGMYTDTTRPNHLAQEVIDNSVDEALAGHCSGTAGTHKPDNTIERIVILGMKTYSEGQPIKVVGSADELQATFDSNTNVLVIRKPGLKVVDDWAIEFQIIMCYFKKTFLLLIKWCKVVEVRYIWECNTCIKMYYVLIY